MATDFKIFRNEKDILSFPAGAVIFTEDEPGEVMYALLEGEVEIKKHGRLLEVVSPSGIFGEMALVDQKPRNASAQAKTDCKVARISEARFMMLIQQTPFFALQVIRIMAERIRVMAREINSD